MKKTIVWLVAFSFVASLSLVGMARAEEELELEKISSPEQIKQYRVMKNENGTLYGIRLQNQSQVKSMANTSFDMSKLEKIPSPDQLQYFKVMKKEGGALFGVRVKDQNGQTLPSVTESGQNSATTKNREDKASGVLEKIGAPQLIPLYENIKKVGNALWGIKKAETTSINSQKRVAVKAEAASCVSTAIDVKDAALTKNISDNSSALVEAITSRGVCQKAALLLTDGQFTAMDACVKEFRSSLKKMQEQQKAGHKSAWENYRASLKLCQPASDTQEGELIIEDGSEKLADIVSDLGVE